MDEHLPESQASGSLVPPMTPPPSALAASAPLAPRGPSSVPVRAEERGVRRLVEAAFDALDTLGDRIADAAGLR
jgi:hypothetical protein